MAETSEFFTDYMPKKIEEKRAAGKDLVADVKAISSSTSPAPASGTST